MKKLSDKEKAALSDEEFKAYMDEKYTNDRFGGIDDMDFTTDTTPDVIPVVKDESNEDQTGE